MANNCWVCSEGATGHSLCPEHEAEALGMLLNDPSKPSLELDRDGSLISACCAILLAPFGRSY